MISTNYVIGFTFMNIPTCYRIRRNSHTFHVNSNISQQILFKNAFQHEQKQCSLCVCIYRLQEVYTSEWILANYSTYENESTPLLLIDTQHATQCSQYLKMANTCSVVCHKLKVSGGILTY